MKRKAEESWNRDPAWASRQGCCQPSLFCDVRGRFNTVSVGSDASDDAFSFSSSPYMFMNLDAGATSSRQHTVERSASSRGQDVNNANGDSAEAIANIDGEKLLASEMQALSVNEREEIYEEIHIGVRKNMEETPEFIEEKLGLFEQQLIELYQQKPKRDQRGRKRQQQSAAAKQPYEHPSAYQQALFLAPRYLKDSNFRLMFLRSESFDVGKAAAKFVKHFETKKKFFGADKLGKVIDFLDLEDEEVEALRNGAMHVVPNFRNRSGRSVIFDNFYWYKSTNKIEFKTQGRLIWYAFMRELEKDIEAQCSGTVVVMYPMGVCAKDFAQIVVEQRRNPVIPSLPLLGVCAHFCMDNPQLRPIFSMFLAAVPQQHRLRTRIHFGSDMECQYALSTYGIVKDLLPYASDGSVKRIQMEQIVATFRTEDDKHRTDRIEEETSQGIAYYATSLDVLVGKGMSYQNSKGALRMLQLVEQRMPQYIAAEDDRFLKTTLFLGVMRVIQNEGRRFLKRHPNSANLYDAASNIQKAAATPQESGHVQQESEDDPDVWVVLDDEVAREKISAAFRSMVRRALKNRKAILVG